MMPPKRIIYGILGLLAILFLWYSAGSVFENVNAGEIVIIQAPISGKLEIITSAGTYWQGFGTVTRYKKSFQYWFAAPKKGEETPDQSIKVRFNDGGHAQLSGSIRVDMPMDVKSITALHIRYGSQDAIEHALIGQLVSKSVYMTGPMMSSKESNAERRNELIGYIEDQAINGVYSTFVTTTKIKDPMDEKQERTVSVVKIALDGTNTPMRVEKSPAKEFNLRLYNLTINAIDYDSNVEKQIRAQQDLTMQVQTAIAQAKTAEQQAFTAMKEGEAAAATAKWKQEAENAQLIAEADGRRRTAELDAQAALAEKAANISRGQGEAERKRLAMQANNALDAKLDAYIRINQVWAEAFKGYTGSVVPQIQTGGATGGNGAVNFMEMMGMKAARDLSLDMKTR